MTSSNFSLRTRPTGQVLGKDYLSFLDFTLNYEGTSGIFVPCIWVFQMNGSFCNNYQMLTIKIIIDIAMVQKYQKSGFLVQTQNTVAVCFQPLS